MSTTVEQGVIEIGKKLIAQNSKLITAESCTGGGLAYQITEIAGSSAFFDHGFVVYSNAAKETLLGVNTNTLACHGAVSEQTVREMALGALYATPNRVSMAITGIAGPSGGSIAKPVGTVWLGWTRFGSDVHAQQYIFKGNRADIRRQAIEHAVQTLLAFI